MFIFVVVTQGVESSQILLMLHSAYVRPFSPLLSCQHVSLLTGKQIPFNVMRAKMVLSSEYQVYACENNFPQNLFLQFSYHCSPRYNYLLVIYLIFYPTLLKKEVIISDKCILKIKNLLGNTTVIY